MTVPTNLPASSPERIRRQPPPAPTSRGARRLAPRQARSPSSAVLARGALVLCLSAASVFLSGGGAEYRRLREFDEYVPRDATEATAARGEPREAEGGGRFDGVEWIDDRGGEDDDEEFDDDGGDGDEVSVRRYPRWIRLRAEHGAAPGGVRRRDRRLRKLAMTEDDNTEGEPGGVSVLVKDDTTPPPEILPGCAAPLHARPTCNSVHEIDVPLGLQSDLLRKVSKGAVRNVWSVLEAHDGGMGPRRRDELWKSGRIPYVLKTLRWTRDYIPPIYHKQIREAVALEYLTSSDGTMDIFGFCGASTVNSYAMCGNLADYVKRRLKKTDATSLSPAEILTIAARLARAVANMQDGGRRTSHWEGDDSDEGMALQVVHRDIGASNILVSGEKPMRVSLDDFNQGYVLRRYNRDSSSGKMCTYRDLFICGEDGRRPDTRSPEECKGNAHLSQSIDTYGMGTVFFYLLTNNRAYSFNAGAPGPPDEYPDWYRDLVMKGKMPELPPGVESHQNRAIVAVKKAMRDAMVTNPNRRPSASTIASFLENELKQYRNTSLKLIATNKNTSSIDPK